jgi:MoxR-like ATPase
MAMQSAARAYAFLQGRNYVTIDDVKAIIPSVCGHRLRDGRNVTHQSAEHLTQWLLSHVPAIGA